MKFYFNYLTDEARDALDANNIQWRRNPSGGIDVYTENFDLADDDYRVREVDPLDPDRKRAFRAQGVRVWKHPDTGDYYYLISDVVFRKYDRVKNERHLDYRGVSSYGTNFVAAVLDVVPPEEQGSWRDRLMQLQPPAESGRFL